MANKLTHTSEGVAHHLPHRTRLRLAKHHRKSNTVETVGKKLEKVPGVKSVEVNERTGSILIHHDENKNVLHLMGEALQEVATDLFEVIVEEEMEALPGLSLVSKVVTSQAGRLNEGVSGRTNNWIDLKMIVPLGFFGIGMYKLIRERAWLSEVPAFVLIYYAFDSYMKFHGPHAQHAHSNGNGGNGSHTSSDSGKN